MTKLNELIETILDTFATYQGRTVSVTLPEERRGIYKVLAVGDGRERKITLERYRPGLRTATITLPDTVTLYGYEILGAFQGAIIRVPGNLPLELDSPRGEGRNNHD